MEQSKISSVNRINLFVPRKGLDERAFELAFAEHYQRIYTVIFRLVGDRDEADDLTAETFWQLWNHPPAQDENLAGWLYRVATRLGYNALRAARRRTHYETSSGDFEIQTSPDPASEAEKRLERQRVRETLRKMSMRDVQILILRHSGLSYKEIAQAVQAPTASIGKELSRAEEKFERLYGQGDRHAPEK